VRNKASSERALFRMYHESRFPLVTIRPPFVYGPDNPFYREQYFWDRLKHDQPIIIPGDGNRLMQFVYVNDLVEACFAALEKHTAPGRAFNVADEKALTQVDVVNELAKAMGKQAQIVRVPREILMRNGGNAFAPPYYFGQYLDVAPITMAVGRVKRCWHVNLDAVRDGAEGNLQVVFEAWADQAAGLHVRGQGDPAGAEGVRSAQPM